MASALDPSGQDRQSNPDLPDAAALNVLLHEVPLDNGETLYLVITLDVRSEQAGELYQRRYDVQHDIRDVKVTLDTENIRAKSVSMVKKELLTSIVAYNLVVQFYRQAAELAGVPPRRLSFTGVWNTFESFLLHQPPCNAETWKKRQGIAGRLTRPLAEPSRPQLTTSSPSTAPQIDKIHERTSQRRTSQEKNGQDRKSPARKTKVTAIGR